MAKAKASKAQQPAGQAEDRFEVSRLPEFQPTIYPDGWRFPLVRRLIGNQDDYADGEAAVADSFRRGSTGRATNGQVLLSWKGLSANDYARYLRTMQKHVITEHAALGFACIALRLRRPDLDITEVTLLGDRADYWIGKKEFLLEVAGREGCDLQEVRNEKRDQLQDNPHGKDGYVCVVDFPSRRAFLWFYRSGA